MKLITHTIYLSTITVLCLSILTFISIWRQTVSELHRLNLTATAQLQSVIDAKHRQHGKH